MLSRLAAFGSLLNAALLVQPHVAAERHNEDLSIASPFQASLLLPAGEQAEPGLFQPRTLPPGFLWTASAVREDREEERSRKACAGLRHRRSQQQQQVTKSDCTIFFSPCVKAM